MTCHFVRRRFARNPIAFPFGSITILSSVQKWLVGPLLLIPQVLISLGNSESVWSWIFQTLEKSRKLKSDKKSELGWANKCWFALLVQGIVHRGFLPPRQIVNEVLDRDGLERFKKGDDLCYTLFHRFIYLNGVFELKRHFYRCSVPSSKSPYNFCLF